MAVIRFGTIVLALLVCPWLSAQTASVFGTVTDSSGASLANAPVTATQDQTKVAEKVTTNETGNYVFPTLRPGTYTISCEVSGFRTQQVNNVLIEVNQRARVDLSMQVGEVKETLSVAGSVTTVDTFSSTVKEVVDTGRVVELPLNGRQAVTLQALLPGAVQVPAGSAASFIAINTDKSFAINGARANQSSYTLDGGLNMDGYNNLAAAYPNPDALQEFSILQSSYSAVYGRNAGAVVNMITKSGTNALHGALWEFLRNDVLNTRNFFAAKVDNLKRNQFGAAIGGPVVLPHYNGRDRTFFFVSYEGTRQVQALTNSSIIVPSALERQGNFSQSKLPAGRYVADPTTVTASNPQGVPFPGNIVPTNRLDPVALNFTNAFFPLPNSPGNIAAYSVSLPTVDDQLVFKIDHSFSTNNKLSLRYFWDDYTLEQNAALPAFNSQNNWVTQNANLTDTQVFSPRLINTFTFNFARNTFIRGPLVTTPANWAALGCKSCVSISPAGVPTDWALTVANGLGLRVNTNFFSYMQNWQYIDTFNATLGNHLLSFGFDIAYLRRNGHEYFQKDTQFSFDGTRSGALYGYADFFLGAAATVYQNSPIGAYQYKYTPFLFIQDDWRVSRNLTLNLGLRWEPFPTVKERNNQLAAFRPGRQSTVYPLAPVDLLFPGDPGIQAAVVGNDYNKWAPRVGFAYDPFGNGKTSIRGGYGIFHDSIRLVDYNGNSVNQPYSLGVTTFAVQLSDPYATAPQTLQQLTTYEPPGNAQQKQTRQFIPPVNVNSIDPYFTNAYMQQWNFNVQRELWKQVVLTIGYLGSKGNRLTVNEQINPAIYIPGASTTTNVNARRIYQGFGTVTNNTAIANSTYNSFQVSWNRRFSGGFTMLGSYVYAKTIDLASNDGGGGLGNQATNPFNYNLDKGLADFDVRQRFVTSFIYELPFFRTGKGWVRGLLGGWEINGILTLQTGLPFTVNAGTDRSLAGVGKDRADVHGDVATYNNRSNGAKIAKYFDTSAFSLPALGTFGTTGRNTLESPGLENLDAGLFKAFRIQESKQFQIRWEVFNALNRPNFAAPNGSFTSSNFGRITSALSPRIMQVAAKFVF